MDTDLKFTLQFQRLNENEDLVLGIKNVFEVGRSNKLMGLLF